jgi:thioredoxin reductase
MDKKLDTDILIVGVGPVGLFPADECARRKLRYRIIEARATQSEHSKALECAAIPMRKNRGKPSA